MLIENVRTWNSVESQNDKFSALCSELDQAVRQLARRIVDILGVCIQYCVVRFMQRTSHFAANELRGRFTEYINFHQTVNGHKLFGRSGISM